MVASNSRSPSQATLERPGRERSSGAYVVTVGPWRITSRFLAINATYDIELHPNGTASGSGRWAISRAVIAGRWFFDPADQVKHLELSGGIQKGTKAMPVKITRWVSPDSADCLFEGRRARLERVLP